MFKDSNTILQEEECDEDAKIVISNNKAIRAYSSNLNRQNSVESKGKRSMSSQSSDKENGSAIRHNEAAFDDKSYEKISFSLNEQYF